ncbi:class F sortase [Kocuria sp.]|uniref:class F sortase n=1 Tax=Kocuria sp. TaxID=1871328 RepID=UPI0026E0DB1A|nr:class F sortase [Kocuria sp.]MDO5618499.1 class F sortase [Kocuria sp.]
MTIDYMADGQSNVLQSIGIEDRPLGPADMATSPGSATAPAAEHITATGTPAPDYSANADGLPNNGMEGVDLSGISPGGGQGPPEHDWATMNRSELAVPQANLIIPVVPRDLVNLDGNSLEMDLPVSFQAGWLTSSSPVSAQSGTTVVAGHVNWADGSWAPMSNLYNTTPGMTVLTSDDFGSVQEWTVTRSEGVPQTELSHLFTLTETSGPRQLILITCEATVDSQGNLVFDKNHVVTASPKQ